jgi:hypothetical protein
MRLPATLTVLSLAALTACGGGVPPAQNYATIQGRAYDVATNQAVSGATVCVDTIDCATTGTDGTYRIGNIPLGSCTGPSVTTVPSGYAVQGSIVQCGSVIAGQVVTIDIPFARR